MIKENRFGLDINIPVCVFKEDKKFIAYSPAIDLSTSGENYEEVRERFNEITEIFFEEIIGKGTLKEVLGDLGWTVIQKKWMPPVDI